MSQDFKPIIYTEEQMDLKYKRMLIQINEKEAYQILKNQHASHAKKMASAMAYYPGKLDMSKKDSPLKMSIPSPQLPTSESDPEFSPKYLFKDLPKKIRTPRQIIGTVDKNKLSNSFADDSLHHASPQSSLNSPTDRSPLRDPRHPSPPVTPRFSIAANLSEVECYPPTPKNHQGQRLLEIEELSPSLAQLDLAHEPRIVSPPLENNAEVGCTPKSSSFQEDREGVESHSTEVACDGPINVSERFYRSEPIWLREEEVPPGAKLTASYIQFEKSINPLASPILSGPRKLRRRRALEASRITKRKPPQFTNLGTKRLRLLNKTGKQNDELLESDENRRASIPDIESTSDECLSRSYQSARFFLLVPKKFNSAHMSLITDFCYKFNGCWMRLQKQLFNPEITHVLAETKADEYNLVDKLRFEHLLAVAHRKYLVSVKWIEDCLAAEALVEAEAYEVRLKPDTRISAARLARESEQKLFEGVAVLCAEPFRHFSKELLEELLAVNGALIARNPTQLRKIKECRERYCVIGERAFYEETKNKEALEKRLKTIAAVHYTWVYECLSLYKKEPPLFYQL